MMRRRVVIPALIFTALGALPTLAVAQFSDPKQPVKTPVVEATQRYTGPQIDNLAGPVALYPDALLAQVLVAATFPDQVQDAADFVRANGTDSIDVQPWDISVKAVAHYPSALNAMAEKIDWTSALGKAYATQSSDVMASVQRLRRMAAEQGNLSTSAQQKIVTTNETVQIVPVETRVIYVPVYDPYVIYSRPIFNAGYGSRYWSSGVGFPIGSWLMYDCDWGLRRVYYNGWSPSYYAFGGGWRQRSRPFIEITNIYVSPRYANVYYDRGIVSRSVNYYNIDRYASVHSGRNFDTRHDGRYDPRDDGRNGTRYAVRNDGNNGSGAVNGGGYRNGNQSGTRDNGNTGGYSNANPPRDGSGYGGSNDRNNGGNNRGNDRGNGGYNSGSNDRGNGGNNGAGNGSPRDGNSNRGGNDGSVRDGNGNRVGNPNGRPPEQRRSEPAMGQSPQIIMPQRRGEPQQPRAPQSQPQQDDAPSQAPRIFMPQQRRAEPREMEHQGQPQRSAPEQRRVEPPQRVEPQRQAPPSLVIQAPPASSGDARTAKRRGGI